MGKKPQAVRWSVTFPPEVDAALKRLSEEWDMSASSVLKMMVGRGLDLENGREIGLEPRWQLPDGNTVPFRDDRPIKSILPLPDLLPGPIPELLPSPLPEPLPHSSLDPQGEVDPLKPLLPLNGLNKNPL